MAFTLGNLLYVCVLLINAVAVLHEERFLARVGLSNAGNTQYSQGNTSSIKGQMVQLISAVRTLLRIPLIIVNFTLIVYELVLGSGYGDY